MQGSIEFLNAARGRIAYRLIDGRGPTIMWFGGFKSDMSGAKAEALGVWAASTVRSYLRFDYSGHGASEGRFEDGTISAWLDDALAVIDEVAKGPLILGMIVDGRLDRHAGRPTQKGSRRWDRLHRPSARLHGDSDLG